MLSAATAHDSMTGACRALECVISRWRFGVPVESVQQVVDVDMDCPPPLAHPWVGGMGLHEGRPLISISLFPSPGRTRRQVKGLWLTAEGAPTGYVLEVSRVGTFVDVEVQRRKVTVGGRALPAFVTAGVVSSRSIGWIDVALMLRMLAGVD